MNTIILLFNLLRFLVRPFQYIIYLIGNLKDILILIRLAYILLQYDILSLISKNRIWQYAARLTPNSKRKLPPALRVQKALITMGPVWVKFGQMLSLRADILPAEFIQQLSKLHDELQPFTAKQVAKIIKSEFKVTDINQVFQTFDLNPVAAASIAQVHRATLPTNEVVAVKILRPNIENQIKQGIRALSFLANLLFNSQHQLATIKPKQLVSEFAKNLAQETNLYLEASNCAKFKENFTNCPNLHTPKVYWPYCKNKVFTMEFVTGVAIDEIDKLQQANLSLAAIAKTSVELFFTQVFEHNFFHADLHPGNLWLDPKADKIKFICLDFGIMGSLSDSDKLYIAKNLLAFFNQDYHKIAKLHLESGWINPDTSLIEFEAEIRAISAPVFELPLAQISFGQTLLGLLKIAARFQMNIQPQLLLLQKNLVNIEGVARRLYPDLDLWLSIKPFLEQWIKDETSIKKHAQNLSNKLPLYLNKIDKFITNLDNNPKGQNLKLKPASNPIVWVTAVATANLLALSLIVYKLWV